MAGIVESVKDWIGTLREDRKAHRATLAAEYAKLLVASSPSKRDVQRIVEIMRELGRTADDLEHDRRLLLNLESARIEAAGLDDANAELAANSEGWAAFLKSREARLEALNRELREQESALRAAEGKAKGRVAILTAAMSRGESLRAAWDVIATGERPATDTAAKAPEPRFLGSSGLGPRDVSKDPPIQRVPYGGDIRTYRDEPQRP
jgi:chromosome segregation ATPase